MVEGRVAIAVLGPSGADAPAEAMDASATVTRRLAEAGYGLVTLGEGGVARAVVDACPDGTPLVRLTVSGGGEDPAAIPRRGTRMSQPNLIRALEATLELADALVLLPGDLQSLATLMQVWAYGHQPRAPYRQVVLLGERWPGIVAALADAAGLDARSRAMVTLASDPAEAAETLRYFAPARS